MVRIYADEDGKSHLEDMQVAYDESDFVPPAPPVSMSSFERANQFAFEVVPPGWHGDWHPAPGRVLAIYLSGQGEIEASDGEVRALTPGSVLLAEDTRGKGHVTRVTGLTEVSVAIVLLPD